jgi:hypothetical protein
MPNPNPRAFRLNRKTALLLAALFVEFSAILNGACGLENIASSRLASSPVTSSGVASSRDGMPSDPTDGPFAAVVAASGDQVWVADSDPNLGLFWKPKGYQTTFDGSGGWNGSVNTSLDPFTVTFQCSADGSKLTAKPTTDGTHPQPGVLLKVVEHEGNGLLSKVTYIRWINPSVGYNALPAPALQGQLYFVPIRSQYFFYYRDLAN